MWLILAGLFLLSAACTGESSNADTVEHIRAKRLTQLPHQYAPLPRHQQQQQQLQRLHQQQQPQQQQYAAPIPPINYRPYNEAPESIKQLLQLQQYREPIVHIPVGPAPQLQPALAPQNPPQPPPPPPQPYLAQYAPKLQYGQVPPAQYKPALLAQQAAPAYKPILQQAAYKGIQAARPNPRVPVQPPQNNYTPRYKTQYPQQGPNGLYRPQVVGPPPGALAKYPSHPQPYLNQYPKNLPPHLQKIIDSQRSYQG